MKISIAMSLMLGMAVLTAQATSPAGERSTSNQQLTAAFVQKQVARNMSIGRAIKSIISHYPQDAEAILSIAFDLYPKQYKEIIHAAISAQPALTELVVTTALKKEISSCASVVKTAINAEPSYVDFVVTAAANATPEELDEIVRVAVIAEPDSADHIVQSLSQSHPNKMVDILKTAIGAVPFVGEYMVDALLAVFPGKAENVVTTAVRESSANEENVRRILEAARNAGVKEEDLAEYAKKGRMSEEQLASVGNDQLN